MSEKDKEIDSSAPASESVEPDQAILSKEEEKAAKVKAAEEAREARAKARAAEKEAESAEPDVPKEPSPNQPRLDRMVQLLKENIANDAVELAYINEKDGHMPCMIINNKYWLSSADLLKNHEMLQLDYLRNVTGIDMETHMEVVYHLLSLTDLVDCCIKVKTDRENPIVASVTGIWATANWNEREIFDLLGIDFSGHPDLRRIMMPDDWVGYPLRKDYEPLDPEV